MGMQNISSLSTDMILSPTLYVLIKYHISTLLISAREDYAGGKT